MKRSLIVSYVLLALFCLFALITWNTEFLIYAAVLIPFVILIHKGDAVFKFKSLGLWGFNVWMLLHLLGGMAEWNGVRFYDYILLPVVGEPYLILKYDQVVHFFCFAVFAILMGSVISKAVSKKANVWLVAFIIIFATMGVGALNEVIEFMPVVFLNSPGPGGYINTAIDLCANMVGAIFGTWFYLRKR
jgi:uncharacterized membrane protein YjdF